MALLATGLGVAQLIGYVGGLILKITREAEKAHRKKRDLAYLVRYLSVIDKMLPMLPEDPEVELPLNQLLCTLGEAAKLVEACKDWISLARRNADAFMEVNARITSDLGLFPFAFHTAIARRLKEDKILPAAAAKQGCGTVTPVESSSTSAASGHVSDDQPSRLTWAVVEAATENLAFPIGEGFSGKVYRGRLQFHFHHGGTPVLREVAVKVLNEHARLGMEDAFVAELETLFPIRHNHIARLLGWCSEWERPMFVYDLMANGALRDHLSGSGSSSSQSASPVASSWKARLDVLLGVSRALLHLHRFATRPVIHRNVTSSNILLDATWTAHLSDFGAAVLRAEHRAPAAGQPVEEVVGTFGYIDPEYSRTRRVSPASDVYSLGVVMLEVLTGKPPVSTSSSSSAKVTLVSSALPVIQTGDLRNVLDGRLAPVTTPQHVEALELVADTAVLCLWPHGKDRPAMPKVVANLDKALGIIRGLET